MQVRAIGHRAVTSLLVVAVVVGLGAASSGCDSKKDEDKKSSGSAVPAAPAPPPPATTPPAAPPPAAPPPAAPPPAAPASDVTRYPNEVPLNRPATIADGVGARKQAKAEAPVFQTLAKGTPVTQIVQSGNWTLVGWKEAAIDKQGWVESAKAFGGQLDPTRQRAADVARKGGLLFPK